MINLLLKDVKTDLKSSKVQFAEHLNILGNLEDPQQAYAAQHRDAERWHHLRLGEHHLADGAYYHEAVETVKE